MVLASVQVLPIYMIAHGLLHSVPTSVNIQYAEIKKGLGAYSLRNDVHPAQSKQRESDPVLGCS